MNKKFTAVRLACAFAIAILLTVIIIFSISNEPGTAIYNLFLGPLQSKRHLFDVFASSIPLMFTGLALGLVFKSGNFSMIADASLYTGGVIAAAIAIMIPLPMIIHPIVIFIVAALIGGVIGSIPAILKVKFKANELVTSLMFNYVFFYLGIYTVNRFFVDREAGTFASLKYSPTATLGNMLSGTKLHWGFVIAIVVVILLYLLVYKTKFGYEIRISGSNPEFAKYSGINTSRVIILTQVIAGAVAGLGGAVEQLGMYQRFNWQDSPSYAWDGVIIAILSGNNPKFVPFAAFFLAYIRVGADLMSRRSDVQNELVSIVQAVLILFITAERFMAGWKQRQEAKKVLKEEA
ncbi:ABC transporter permease [Tyzzerella sp. An114]|uniref:ABC transporter permease n=1 Tax=Tyzzerella sp. An114 TaxID=1965545 RepID=UPI000B42D3ED|nr:ABC transporter permease [Tyzzerella sp. An114]OUQ60584.1 ABC transporter permease [Tyzzerella sp. An114]